jgi:hypothetical protein
MPCQAARVSIFELTCSLEAPFHAVPFPLCIRSVLLSVIIPCPSAVPKLPHRFGLGASMYSGSPKNRVSMNEKSADKHTHHDHIHRGKDKSEIARQVDLGFVSRGV